MKTAKQFNFNCHLCNRC